VICTTGVWPLLPWRAGQLAEAIHVHQAREIAGCKAHWPGTGTFRLGREPGAHGAVDRRYTAVDGGVPGAGLAP
jgi:hypothetical protein